MYKDSDYADKSGLTSKVFVKLEADVMRAIAVGVGRLLLFFIVYNLIITRYIIDII